MGTAIYIPKFPQSPVEKASANPPGIPPFVRFRLVCTACLTAIPPSVFEAPVRIGKLPHASNNGEYVSQRRLDGCLVRVCRSGRNRVRLSTHRRWTDRVFGAVPSEGRVIDLQWLVVVVVRISLSGGRHVFLVATRSRSSPVRRVRSPPGEYDVSPPGCR